MAEINETSVDLPVEGPPNYPMISFFIRFGILMAWAIFASCLMIGVWIWVLTDAWVAALAGAATGLVAYVLIRVFLDLVRVIANMLLPR